MEPSLLIPYKLVLGSGSPRRKSLLEGLHLAFEVDVRPVDESLPKGLATSDAAGYLALAKALPFAEDLALDAALLVLTADTVVVLEGNLLGKPADAAEARNMLRRLSGKSHEVITGFALSTGTTQKLASVRSLVHMAQLSEELIHYYVSGYQPMDKAGAYGIQEFIGMAGVKGIEGCYFNIMGLPTQAVYEALKEFTHADY